MPIPYTVYILRCADGSLYTGIARDVEDRIQVHHSGKGSAYVRARLPAVLVYVEKQPNRSSATKREFQIKQLSKKEKEALLCSLN